MNDELYFGLEANVALPALDQVTAGQAELEQVMNSNPTASLDKAMVGFQAGSRGLDRGFGQMNNGLNSISGNVGQCATLNAVINSAVLGSTAGILAMSALTAIHNRDKIAQTAAAAVETAANAAALNWPGIALAAGAAAGVAAAFYVGQKVGSGEWNVSIDWSHPESKHKVINNLYAIKMGVV